MKQTLQCLVKAFIGESQARNRYTYYATVAQKEGYQQIAAIFLETAEQERTHAKREFEHIQEFQKEFADDMAEIIPGKEQFHFGDTVENLKAAIAGENYEHATMYPEFAKIAAKEKFPKIAARFKAIAVAEAHHEDRFKKLLKQLVNGSVFKKDKETAWACRECGYVHIGKEAPKVCPSCNHPQAYYQVRNEQY